MSFILRIALVLISFIYLANAQKVEILTASKKGNYYSLIKNKKCANGLELMPVVTLGSVENIKLLISKKTYQHALIQSDIVETFNLFTNNEYKNIITVNKILDNYMEVVYVIKLKSNTKIEELSTKFFNKLSLKDKKDFKAINIGKYGTGNNIVGYKIISDLNLGMSLAYEDNDDALIHLINKKISLLIYVAKYDTKTQKHSKWIENILQDYGEYLELISLKTNGYYNKVVKLKNIDTVQINTSFISTSKDINLTKKIFQCINE